MPYPEYLVAPMREELTSLGIKELRTAEAVDQAVQSTQGTLMIVVNSVCGCAAGKARPGPAPVAAQPLSPRASRAAASLIMAVLSRGGVCPYRPCYTP